MWDYYKKFIETVKTNPAVVLVGETGSGKTTQVGGDEITTFIMCIGSSLAPIG